MKVQNLTKKDIIEIKHLKRVGYIIPSLIIFIAVIVNLGLIFASDIEAHISDLLIVDSTLIFISLIISYLMNRKYNRDLSNGTKKIRTEIIIKKEKRTSYEPGSGSLHKPFLGSLFPKVWGQKMKSSQITYFIINNYRYQVEPELYIKLKEGDNVELHFSNYSNTLLGYDICRKKG